MNQLCFLSVEYCKTSELRPKTHKHDRNKTISHLENKSSRKESVSVQELT